MTVMKQWNPTSGVWEPVFVGRTGPKGDKGDQGSPGLSNVPWVDLSQYGAKYDGSDDAPAFQAAVDDADAYAHIHISGPLALGSPVLCRTAITLTGEGFASPISPLPTFPSGQFMLTFQWTQTSPGGRASHLADVRLDNLMFDGKLRTIAANGIRMMQTQESTFSRLNFLNMKGIGFQCYRSVRDSMFHTIVLRACGDYDADLPAFDIYEDAGGTQDSHNNLWFVNMTSAIHAGDALRIECGRDSNMRIFSFVNLKVHGVWTPGTINSDVLLGHYNTNRVVIRNASGVMFTNCRFHETAPGMPLMHIAGHPNVPGSASRVGIDLTNISFGNQDVIITAPVTAGTSNLLTVNAPPHYLATGTLVQATSSTVTGVALSTDYFVIRVDANSIRLATTYTNAKAGTATTTGATGTATLVTQNIRVFIDEGTYGEVRENPGVNIDGPANRAPIISKSHLQVFRQFGTVSSILDPAYYEGVIDETKSELHGHTEIEGVLNHDGTKVGFFGTTPIVKPTGLSAAATLEALGLGSSVVTGTYYSEYPPLSRAPGQQWYVPSVAHLGIWSGTAWKPISPNVADQNICCIIGNSAYVNDIQEWNGITGSAAWHNLGLDAVAVGATPNGNVTQATDPSGRKYAVMNNTNTDVVVGAGVALISTIAAGDSFSTWAVKSQSVYHANSALISSRVSSITAANVGFTLGNGTTTNGVHAMRISDGTTMVEAFSPVVPLNQIRMILGIRNVAADNIEIHVSGEGIVATTTDTTTGALSSPYPPRISRNADTGTGRTAQNLYHVGFTKRAFTATEITTLRAWAAARFV